MSNEDIYDETIKLLCTVQVRGDYMLLAIDLRFDDYNEVKYSHS